MYEFLFEPYYDPFLQSEFILHFSCCVKNAILTTLVENKYDLIE
jgi:hypothetical protein